MVLSVTRDVKNFAKTTEKHLCQSLFFNKVADLKACNFIKKETGTVVCEVFKNSLIIEHFQGLPLYVNLES